LTAEEEADWREHFVNGSGAYVDSYMMRRMFATLDAARAAPQADAGTLDAKRLAAAIVDHGDVCSRMAIPECAADILAALAASSPATAGRDVEP